MLKNNLFRLKRKAQNHKIRKFNVFLKQMGWEIKQKQKY